MSVLLILIATTNHTMTEQTSHSLGNASWIQKATSQLYRRNVLARLAVVRPYRPSSHPPHHPAPLHLHTLTFLGLHPHPLASPPSLTPSPCESTSSSSVLSRGRSFSKISKPLPPSPPPHWHKTAWWRSEGGGRGEGGERGEGGGISSSEKTDPVSESL